MVVNYCFLGLCIGVLSIIAALLWSSAFTPEPYRSKKWSDDNLHSPMTKILAAGNEPMVLYHTPFDQHINSSNILQFLKHSNIILPFKRSTNRVFQYHAVDQPLAQYAEEKSYDSDIMITRELTKLIFQPSHRSSNPFYYSTGDLNLVNVTLKPSLINKLSFVLSNDHSSVQTNYWLGGAGVTAYNHYDTSYNIHYVITGRKRFLLQPPNHYTMLNLYSCLHPLYRQTQIDPAMPNNSMSSALIIDLLPQQALYLPPYWFHTVVTVEPSLSLNVWSDSDDYLVMEDVLKSPIPFESNWSLKTQLKAAKLFINNLVELSKLPITFVRDSVLPRYNSIIHYITDDIRLRSSLPDGCDHDLSDKDMETVKLRSSITSKLFIKMSQASVRGINLGNYIEHILYTLLRRHDLLYIPLFLQQCW